MRRSTTLAGAPLLVALALASPSRALDGPGAAAFDFLQLGSSARLEAMAGAGTAVAHSGDALAFNPARLARARGLGVEAAGWTWLPEVSGTWVSATGRVRRTGVGLAVRSLSVDDFSNVADQPAVGQSDLAVAVGAGRRLGPVAGGAALRLVRSSVADEDAQGWAADAGLDWEWVRGWNVAAAVRNAGPAFAYGDGADEQLPTRSALALGATVGELRIDSEVQWENGPGWASALGAEYTWRRRVFLRSGIRLGDDPDDAMEPWAAGFGLNVRPGLDLDYSFRDGVLDPCHRLGLRWAPGGNGPEEPAPARSPREFWGEVLSRSIDEGLRTLPRDLGDSILVRAAAPHEASQAVSETLAEVLRERGYEPEISTIPSALPDSLAAAPAADSTADGSDARTLPVLEFTVVSSTYRVTDRRRERWVGPESVDRMAAVDLAFRAYRPGGDAPVWEGAGSATDSEWVASARIPSSAGYPPPGDGSRVRSARRSPLVEPAIVGGIVAGLAVIFFSNRNVGE